MQMLIKIFILVAALLVIGFFANFFGFVSIPWLDVASVTTYGDNVNQSDDAVKNLNAQ